MESSNIYFRNFVEEDLDFIYKCKKDAKLNSMVVGNYKPLTYDESRKWLEGCIRADNPKMKFWAICSIEKNKIIGWTSLSEISSEDQSACLNGMLIGDKEYNDGEVMFDTMLLCMDYCFNTLNTHRVYASCLESHPVSPHMMTALGFRLEGKRVDAVVKNGVRENLLEFGLLDNEYETLLSSGEYKSSKLARRFVKSLKGK